MYYLSSINGDVLLTDEDTLTESKVSVSDFVHILESGIYKNCINGSSELKFAGCSVESIKDNIEKLELCSIFEYSDVDIELLGRNFLSLGVSGISSSWRRNRYKLFKNNIKIYGDSIRTYILYDNILYVVKDIDILLSITLEIDTVKVKYTNGINVCTLELCKATETYLNRYDVIIDCAESRFMRICLLG